MKFLNTIFAFLAIVFIFSQCNTYQPMDGPPAKIHSSQPPGLKPGACYAKSKMPNQYETYQEKLWVYTGELGSENIQLEEVEIAITPPVEKWVKKRTNMPCRSRNPDDCLVWCLEKSKGEYITRVVVVDTTQTENFREEWIEIKELTQKGGHMDWVEVVCENEVNQRLIANLRAALNAKGYHVLDVSDDFSEEMQKVLKQYQVDNNLPVGSLNILTMNHLGIK